MTGQPYIKRCIHPRGLLFVVVQLFCFSLFSQQALVKRYTIEDGLIANHVKNVFQDSKGFIWFTTWYGISRYDGNRFVNYNTDNGLSHNLVNGIFEEDGDFYVAMLNGSIDRISRGKITRNAITKRFVVTRFIERNDGRYYATTNEDGIISLKNGKASRITKPLPGSSSDYLRIGDSLFLIGGVFFDDTQDNPYRNIYSYLLLTDKEGNITTYVDAKELAPIRKLYRDSQGRIWAGSDNGLLQLQVSKNKHTGKYEIKVLPLPKDFEHRALLTDIKDIMEDREGNLWIATLAGLIKVNKDGKLIHFSTTDHFPSDRINGVFEDREGNIWVVTDHGVVKLPLYGHISRFTTADGLANNELQDVFATKEKIWFTTHDGFLQTYDSKTGDVQTVARRTPSYYRFLRMSNGKTYIGQGSERWRFNEIAEFDPVKGPGNVVLNPETSFYHAETDSLGSFFLATHEGVYVYNNQGTGYPLEGLEHRITSLMFDRQGYLWATTWGGGLFRLKLTYNTDGIRATVESMNRYFSADPVSGLFEDTHGNIWVGSRYEGVAKLMPKAGGGYTVTHYTTAKGLTSFFTLVGSGTSDEGVLLRSSLGIDKITRDGRIFNFSAVNHFFEEIRGISSFGANTYWAATTLGLIHFEDRQTDTLPPPPVYITKVITSDSLVHSPDVNKALLLKFDQNNLNLKFAAPTFINENAVSYSYRLSGSDAGKWSDPSTGNEVSFASLRPGNYTFEVRALGWNGQWGPAAAFSFAIYPPWWETWWFYGLLFLVLGLTVLFFVRRRIKYIRYQEGLKQKITETELVALRAQMNPHFIFNIFNSIEGYIRENDSRTATVLVQKFAWLSRLILENSASSLVSVDREWTAIKLYVELEAIRFDNSFSYKFSIPKPFDMKSLFIPPMLVQPLVENAIHHGIRQLKERKGRLQVILEQKDKTVCFTVIDNGVGIGSGKSRDSKPSYKKSSKGLYVIAERLMLLNKKQLESKASLALEDVDGQGTRAVVCIPYSAKKEMG